MTKSEIIALLNGAKVIEQKDVKELLSKDKYIQHSEQLVKLLNTLKSEHIAILDSQHDNTIKLISNKVKADLKLFYDENGLLEKVLLQVDSPIIKNFNELQLGISLFADSFVVGAHLMGKTYQYGLSSKSYAVASLIKLLVAVVILEALQNHQLDYDFSYRIELEDISYLSAGLSIKDVGRTKTVRELLGLLLLASDNSAMDILLKMIRQYNLYPAKKTMLDEAIRRVVPTKEWLEAAWCNPEEDEETWRKKALTQVKWIEGLDYFMTSDLIISCIRQLVTYEWLPYDELGTLVYKGGNSAGVLSGAWVSRYLNTCGNYVFFAVNNHKPIDILEQTYYQQCLQSFIENNKSAFIGDDKYARE
ncbi:serine hydrolase [Streptococcus devriesei]